MTSIVGFAFYYCTSLTSITVDEKNENYSSVDGVLFDKNQTELIRCPAGREGEYTIPDSVTTIGEGAFGSCTSLTSITIPDSVTSIELSAFGYCESLTSITIPDSVTGIGDSAFYECTSLTDVYYIGTEEEWNAISIGYLNSCLTSATIHFSDGTSIPLTTGDLDGDDTISLNDAYLALLAYANAQVGLDADLTDTQETAADIDGDGAITINDAYYILLYYAQSQVGLNPTWEELLNG